MRCGLQQVTRHHPRGLPARPSASPRTTNPATPRNPRPTHRPRASSRRSRPLPRPTPPRPSSPRAKAQASLPVARAVTTVARAARATITVRVRRASSRNNHGCAELERVDLGHPAAGGRVPGAELGNVPVFVAGLRPGVHGERDRAATASSERPAGQHKRLRLDDRPESVPPRADPGPTRCSWSGGCFRSARSTAL